MLVSKEEGKRIQCSPMTKSSPLPWKLYCFYYRVCQNKDFFRRRSYIIVWKIGENVAWQQKKEKKEKKFDLIELIHNSHNGCDSDKRSTWSQSICYFFCLLISLNVSELSSLYCTFFSVLACLMNISHFNSSGVWRILNWTHFRFDRLPR